MMEDEIMRNMKAEPEVLETFLDHPKITNGLGGVSGGGDGLDFYFAVVIERRQTFSNKEEKLPRRQP